MSLANRILFVVVALIAMFGALSGYALYSKVRRSLKDEMEQRQHVRLAWVESCLKYNDRRIEFEPSTIRESAAEFWKIATIDGRVLWESPAAKNTEQNRMSTEAHRFELGPKASPEAFGNELTETVDSNGRKLYQLPFDNARISLMISARMLSGAQYAELSRLRWALLTVIPIGVFFLAILLTWFVRVQLRPLEALASAAASIGPGDTTARISIPCYAIEIVQLRNALNGMIERMAEGLERERRFSSYAAHELRTPLAQLRANIEVTLRRDRTLEEYKRYMSDALQDIERLQKLVIDLLHLTRAQELAASDTCHVALDSVLAQAVRATGHNLELPVASKTFVKGNEELLVAAVRNVLDNAARYAPEAPPSVMVEAKPDTVRLEIMDTGPGIPETEQERIFQPLTRLDDARSVTERNDGFGLGLAIARAAVRAGGGELNCRSRADGRSGACFVFEFKRVQPIAI